MAEKTVTIVIDEKGNSEIDLEGFADNSCSKVFDEFRRRDKVKTEQKKSAFYTPQPAPNQVRTSR